MIGWAGHRVIVSPLWLGSMPAIVYRWYFGAHSLRSLERNVLAFAGIRPCLHTLAGMAEGIGDRRRRR